MGTRYTLTRRLLLAVLLFLLVGTSARSQGRVDKYTTQNFSGTFTDISGTGTPFSFGYWWSGTSTNLSMPFAFNYDNTAVGASSTVRVWTAGVVQLNPSGSVYYDYVLNASAYPGALCFYNGYIAIGDGNNGDNTQYYQTTGTAPNRVFIIQLRRVHHQGSGSYQGNGGLQTTMQVKLYESTNVIEFLYKDHGKSMGNIWSGRNPGIGLNGFTSPTFASLTYSSGTSSTPSSDIRFTPPPPPPQMSLQPKRLNFGSVLSSGSVTLCTTVKSVGVANLQITGATISGVSDYQIVSGPANGTILAPGATADYCIRFTPFAPGTRNATLTVTSSGADSGTQAVSLTGVGIAPGINMPVTSMFRKTRVLLGDSVTASIPVQSTGTGPLTIKSFQIVGLNPNDYYVSKYPVAPIPVGAWDSIYVTFKPSLEGRPDATLLVNSDGFNQPQVTVTLFGVGILPRLVISPTTLVFDTTAIGTQNCQQILLKNTGSSPLTITKDFLSSADYDFTLQPLVGSDTILQPDQSRSVTVCFTPLNLGTRLATMRILTNIPRTMETPSRDTSQFTVQIRGVGLPVGALALTGAVDSVIIKTTACRMDTLTNFGTAAMTITKMSLVTRDSADWSITGVTLPLTIQRGQKIPINLCVTPSAAGARATSLVLTGTTNGKPQVVTIPLAAYGLNVCASASTQALFTDAKVLVGQHIMDSVVVQNCGEVAMSYTASMTVGAGSYTISGSPISPVVAPGGSTTYYVTFAPITRGTASGTLTITGAASVTPLTVALGGLGAGVTATATGQPGQVAQGDCKTFDVVIKNEGNIDWTPGTATLAGINAADYSIVSQVTPGTIAPGSTGVVQVKFCPTSTNSETATLSFSADAPAANFSYVLSGSGITSSVSDRSEERGFRLGQSYPNPANHTAAVNFYTPTSSAVRFDILDVTGKMVRTLLNGVVVEGEHTVAISAEDLAAGTYYYVMTAGDVHLTRQFTIVK